MKVLKFLLAIPVLGTIVGIANSYVYHGDDRASHQFAGLGKWIKSLGIPIGISVLLSSVTLWPAIIYYIETRRFCLINVTEFATKPGSVIVSVLPNLVGFGIGVYALVFSLKGIILRDLAEMISLRKARGSQDYGAVLMINADFAYPLLVLVITIAIGVLQQGNSSEPFVVVAWVCFWYSMVISVEIIGVLFGLGDQTLLEQLAGSAASDARSSTGDQDT